MSFHHDRAQVEPEGKYPSQGLKVCEKLALRVLQHLPAATIEGTRDVIQINYAGEGGVVVLTTAEAIEIRLPTIEWTNGAHGPASSSVLWKRLKDPTDEELCDALDKAIWARRRQFRKCTHCGKAFPPKRMTLEACHGCASQHLGIVY